MDRIRPKASDGSNERRKVPRWLPITFLTVTTAALTVPAVLLWRQKRAFKESSPSLFRRQPASVLPVRRRPLNASSSSQTETRPQSSVFSSTGSTPSAPPPQRSTVRLKTSSINTISAQKSSRTMTPEHDHKAALSASLFYGPLLPLFALGIATATVGVGALLGVWAIQKSLDVNNVDEFSARVRGLLSTHFPVLSRRIYRTSSETVNGTFPSPREYAPKQSINHDDEWTWDAAEDRLREAFDRGGINEWAECAVRELEAEQRAERTKRGL